ncbi:hypothetical protein Gotur_026690, partial [Gossypium turneri]
MGNGFLDRVEDNAAVRTWSEKIQREKGDSLAVGYVSKLWDFTRVSVAQNNLQELKEIWDQWDNEVRQLLYLNYGDLPYLLDMKVDKRLFRALAQFWNPAYSCFTFGRVDLVPTIKEYTALLRCSKVQVDRIYSKADLILAHPDARKKVDVFALSIYGLILFPKVLGHVDEAVTDLFDRLDKGVTLVPVILAETFRSLNVCRRTRKVFSESYSPLKEIVATSRRDDISKEKWMAIFQSLQEEDIEWRAPWLLPDEILYKSRQFVPVTQGLAECEFSYKDDGYKRKAREMANAWNQTRRMKRLVEHFRVIPSELEIIKQDLERRNAELEKKIEQMEEEKVNLKLDIDAQKLKTEGLRKGKRKVEEDLNSLKTDYKRLRLSVRTAGLGKTSEQ